MRERFIDTALGTIRCVFTDKGLYGLELPGDIVDRGSCLVVRELGITGETARSSWRVAGRENSSLAGPEPKFIDHKPNSNFGDLEFEEKIRAYFNGEKADFSDTKVDFSGYTDFERKLFYTIMKNVGYGATISYGEAAFTAGFPGASRAAGNALHKNRLLVVVPCHRVIKKDGKIGGWSGKAGWKEILLSLEEKR